MDFDFDLVTLEYDLINSPRRPADEIRRLASDETKFDRLRQELPKHILQVSYNQQLFRVREHDGVPTEPWPGHGMRGHPDFPWARANVDGQPVIYCADSTKTAFDEVRAKQGTWFTIATLRPRRLLKLVSVVGSLGDAESSLALIDGWMSRRVNDRTRVLRPYPAANKQEYYYATQFFSCLARETGYDGVQFSSSVHEGGTTFALFDPYCVDIVDLRLGQT
jgi:hypothetical protein